jgi:hypothetical protein
MRFTNVRYIGHLDVRYLRKKIWMMLAPFRCEWEGGHLIVPEGFVHDFASIPWLAQWLIPVVDDHNWPAVVHDWCYKNKGKLDGLTMTRADADALFLAGLKAMRVNFFRRWAMYSAVRVGGWAAWRD